MISKPKAIRETATDAIDILNDLMNEIMTGVDVYRCYLEGRKAGRVSFEAMASVQRLCFTNIILALNKIREFNKRYLRIVPQVHRAALIQLQENIVAREIPDFRDHCIGHIWNRKTNQPVKHSEIMNRLSVIVGAKPKTFVNWLHLTGRSDTVADLLETVRDALMKEHVVTRDEVIGR